MSENPFLKSAIQIIESLTREDTKLGAQAFRIWKECRPNPDKPGCSFDPAQCVDIAIEELYGKNK